MGLAANLIRLGLVVGLTLFGVCIFRALIYFPAPKDVQTCSESTAHKAIGLERGLLPRFQKAIQFKTITKSKNNYDAAELKRFISFIETSESHVAQPLRFNFAPSFWGDLATCVI